MSVARKADLLQAGPFYSGVIANLSEKTIYPTEANGRLARLLAVTLEPDWGRRLLDPL
jgi:hypothetical protein